MTKVAYDDLTPTIEFGRIFVIIGFLVGIAISSVSNYFKKIMNFLSFKSS